MLSHKRFAAIPLFTLNEDGSVGRLRRQCTREYKIEVVVQKMRELMGLKKRQRVKRPVDSWLGISMDEVIRAKESRIPWQTNRHPLIDMGWRRSECLKYLKEVGLPEPVKSACIFCPYHDNMYWDDMKRKQPEDWAEAVEFDKAIRHITRGGIKRPVFLHRSCKPLGEVDTSDPTLALFGEECEGVCGT